LHKSQIDCNKFTHKSPDETERAWSRSLLQMRDSDSTALTQSCVYSELHASSTAKLLVVKQTIKSGFRPTVFASG